MNKQSSTFDRFFSECYLKYRVFIKNYIAIRICHPYEAEDLAQDVFVRLWEHRAFVNKDTVWSLLVTIARNLVTDKIRRTYIIMSKTAVGIPPKKRCNMMNWKNCITQWWKIFLLSVVEFMN